MTTAGSPSMTAPKKTKMTAVAKRNTVLLPGTTVIRRMSVAGICWTVRNHETSPAVPRSSPTAPVTIADFTTISGRSRHLISRYTKSPTIAA